MYNPFTFVCCSSHVHQLSVHSPMENSDVGRQTSKLWHLQANMRLIFFFPIRSLLFCFQRKIFLLIESSSVNCSLNKKCAYNREENWTSALQQSTLRSHVVAPCVREAKSTKVQKFPGVITALCGYWWCWCYCRCYYCCCCWCSDWHSVWRISSLRPLSFVLLISSAVSTRSRCRPDSGSSFLNTNSRF